ncbi:RNA polymerase sigma factor [Ornithinibacillus xuwenensis]|uniref:RNA polymerase sigma factor n=1 Tax=Ornithinibacillus xuwenensis TaxID=3144668 RepID=A0ABU9XJH6_9BACI
MDRLKDKEENALIQLMNQYGDYLVRTALLLLKDYQTAEEVVQDTFVIAFEKMKQLEDPTKLKSWLTSITVNCCRSRMRKWSWKNVLLHLDNVDKEQVDESMLTPEEALIDFVWNQNLSEAIQKLDYKYREVITLYYFNELKINEIALYTKSKESTIKSRLKRARFMLKELLQKGDAVIDKRERTNKGTSQQ